MRRLPPLRSLAWALLGLACACTPSRADAVHDAGSVDEGAAQDADPDEGAQLDDGPPFGVPQCIADAGSVDGYGTTISLTCISSIAAFCASVDTQRPERGVWCDMTYPEYLADSTHFCSGSSRGDCAGYHVVSVFANQARIFTYYYDSVGGALVAVNENEDNMSSGCVGGPTSFVEPLCCSLTPVPATPCTDGG